MNNVRTGVRSVWKRSWTFLGVILQRFGSERDISYRPVPTVDSRYIEPRSSGYRPRTLVLYIDYRPGDWSITYTYIRIAFSIELRLRVSRSLRSLANDKEPRIRNVGGARPQPFMYVPAASNIVTNGKGTGTKNVSKETVRLGLSLVSSLLSTALLL